MSIANRRSSVPPKAVRLLRPALMVLGLLTLSASDCSSTLSSLPPSLRGRLASFHCRCPHAPRRGSIGIHIDTRWSSRRLAARTRGSIGKQKQSSLAQSHPDAARYDMWSPDGSHILFNTNRDGDQKLYFMGADGSSPTDVTHSPDSTEGLGDWAPQGDRLVVYCDRHGHKDLWLIELETGQWTALTNDIASDEFSTWSP